MKRKTKEWLELVTIILAILAIFFIGASFIGLGNDLMKTAKFFQITGASCVVFGLSVWTYSLLESEQHEN